MMIHTPFDSGEFRAALGAFTTGVTIVTTRSSQGAATGVTANSFNSVSLDPPMVLWSLGRKSSNLLVFEEAEYWTVHILAADQDALSTRFAKSGGDKFAGLSTAEGFGGAPLLSGCAARFQCKTAFRYEGGDHVIFVGEVIAFDHRDVPVLAFHRGKYALASHRPDPASVQAATHAAEGLGQDHGDLGYLIWQAYRSFRSRIDSPLADQDLDIDSFMLMAALLHHDGSRLPALTADLPPAEQDYALRARQLARRGLLRLEAEGDDEKAWLTDYGRATVERIDAQLQGADAASSSPDQMEVSTLKNLLRRFTAKTGASA